MAAERRSVTVLGVQLAYLEWGSRREGHAPLLLIHGLMASAETLDLIGAPLAQDRHVLALDLPGNGGSERRSDIDASFLALAKLLRAFCESLALGRPVILGHSHGGAIALRLAVEERDYLSGLILLCPAHPFSGHERRIVRFYLSPFGRAFAHLLPRLPKQLQERGFRLMMHPSARIDAARPELYQRSLRIRGTVSHTLRLLQSWAADMEALRAELVVAPIETPALVLWGAADQVVPASTAIALTRYLPNSQLVILPGVGHLPNEEAPERCAQLIEDWLGRLERTEALKLEVIRQP